MIGNTGAIRRLSIVGLVEACTLIAPIGVARVLSGERLTALLP